MWRTGWPDVSDWTQHMLAVSCIIPPVLNPSVVLPQLRRRSQRRCSTWVIIHFLSLFGDLPTTFIGDKTSLYFFHNVRSNFFSPSGKYLASYTRDARKKAGRASGQLSVTAVSLMPTYFRPIQQPRFNTNSSSLPRLNEHVNNRSLRTCR
jgi:hypothetical protein